MTLGILAAAESHAAPWGWWDEDDSLARPVAFGDSLEGIRGRARASVTSTAGGPANRDLDASLRRDGWEASVAGRCDSHCVATRRRLSWHDDDSRLEAGDLAPWSDEPLLEGSTPRQTRRGPFSRLGSANRVAGFDAEVHDGELLPWSVGVHSRVSSSTAGGVRSSMLAGAGVFRLGLASSSDPAARPLGLGGIVLDEERLQLQASHLGPFGNGAWRIALRTRTLALHQEWEILHGPTGDLHDRLPAGMAGSTQAAFRMRWSEGASKASVEGRARSDSTSRQDLLLLGAFSRDAAGWTGRLRSRWTRSGETDRIALTPGIARSRGEFRPWVEATWSDAATPRSSVGIRWIRGTWNLDASTTRRSAGRWDWKVASALATRSGMGMDVSIDERDDALAGGGAWTANF